MGQNTDADHIETLYTSVADTWNEHDGVPVHASYEYRTPVLGADMDDLPDHLPLPSGARTGGALLSIVYDALQRGESGHHKDLEHWTRQQYRTHHFSTLFDSYSVATLAAFQEQYGDDDTAEQLTPIFERYAQDMVRLAGDAENQITVDDAKLAVFPYLYKTDHLDEADERFFEGGYEHVITTSGLARVLGALDAAAPYLHGETKNRVETVLDTDYDPLFEQYQIKNYSGAGPHTLTQLDDMEHYDDAVVTFLGGVPTNDVDPVVNLWVNRDGGFDGNNAFVVETIMDGRFDAEHQFYANPLYALGEFGVRIPRDDTEMNDRLVEETLTYLPDDASRLKDWNPADSAAVIRACTGRTDPDTYHADVLQETLHAYIESDATHELEGFRFKASEAKTFTLPGVGTLPLPLTTFYGGSELLDIYLLETALYVDRVLS